MYVQPPFAAALIEVGRLGVRGFRNPQRGVIQQADQPAAAFVVLLVALRQPGPLLDAHKHVIPQRVIEVALDPAGSPG
jgi:hypothetical protein